MSEQSISVISDTLEQCAESSGDITDTVYERFFARCPEAQPLMGHSDQGMKGRMLAQVIELLLTDEHLGEDGYLRWEVDNHLLAYGVAVDMYTIFMDVLRDTVREGLGNAWGPVQAEAWASRINTLLEDINTEAQAQAEGSSAS